MADTKITALTALTAADPANDVLPIVDVSDTTMAASGTTKKISVNNILGCSGTATLASATITGDLTVDTSTLKVDSANNYVGIGTASPVQSLTISGEASVRVNDLIYWNGYYNAGFKARATGYAAYIGEAASGDFVIANTASSAAGAGSSLSFLDRYRISNSGVHTWEYVGGVAGTAMTLNSTGLGVGTSPSKPLHVYNTTESTVWANTTTGIALLRAGGTGGDFYFGIDNSTGGGFGQGNYSRLIYSTGAYPIVFSTNATERMRIDSSGNLGIGVTPSAWNYGKVIEFGGGSIFTDSGNNECSIAQGAYNNAGWKYKYTGLAVGLSSNYLGTHAWYTAPSGTAGNAITWTQAMTLDASGRLLVGTTSTLIAADVRLHVEGSQGIVAKSTGGFAYYPFVAWNTATSGDNVFSAFGTEATYTARGSISYNRAGGLVAYNTTSDYRAKDIIGPVVDSGSIVDSLKVYLGKMKGATIERPMLIAHEAQEVAPYAVTGTKDEVDADGNPKYQQMDASALVPLLIAEIQSLRARVQTLETR